MLTYQSHSEADTWRLAAKIAQGLKADTLIRLDGPLGSGKTSFTKGLGQALGIQRAIKSPTYTIVKQYPLPEAYQHIKILTHIDAYRLEDGGAESVDLDSFLTNNALVVIEWADFIEDYLPASYLHLSFQSATDPNKRIIKLTVHGSNPNYEELLHSLADNLNKECES